MGKNYTASDVLGFFEKHQIMFSDQNNSSIAARLVAQTLNDSHYTSRSLNDRLAQILRVDDRKVRDFANDVMGKSEGFSLTRAFSNASSQLGEAIGRGVKEMVSDFVDHVVPRPCSDLQSGMNQGKPVLGNNPVNSALRTYACGPKMPDI